MDKMQHFVNKKAQNFSALFCAIMPLIYSTIVYEKLFECPVKLNDRERFFICESCEDLGCLGR